MTRPQHHEHVLEVARTFKDGCLRSDGSLFTPESDIWTLESAADFHERFVVGEDRTPDTSFEQRMHAQLEGASDGTWQFAAELLFLHVLPISNMAHPTKRALINIALGKTFEHVPVPELFDRVLGTGIVNFGQALTQRYYHLSFLAELIYRWKGLDAGTRDALLADPWEFKNWTEPFFMGRSVAQREILLHLLFPDSFDPVVNTAWKRQIVNRFAHVVPGHESDIDRKLLAVRHYLSDEFGEHFNFWDPLVRPSWDKNADRWDEFIFWAARYLRTQQFYEWEIEWKLEAGNRMNAARTAVGNNADDWLQLLGRGFKLPDLLADFRVYGPFLTWCESAQDDALRALRSLWFDSKPFDQRMRSFLDQLPRDVASGPSARLSIVSQLLMGEDVRAYPFFKVRAIARGYRLIGEVPDESGDEVERYLAAVGLMDRIIEQAQQRGLELTDRMQAQSIVWAMSSWIPDAWSESEINALKQFRGDESTPVTIFCEEDEDTGSLLTMLAESLYIDASSLVNIKRLLEDRKQAIFFGPPGTGKTFIALKLAEFLTGDRECVDLVQFHAAYAYEDFVEGFRPREINGQPGFQLENGPLKRIARRAQSNPGQTYVLIIDEINRANIARVFGELYFLLEYREESVSLQYSPEEFSLPNNLLIIGTMNTADRSIALIDAALRRRFYFIPFFPTDPPIKGILHRWFELHNPDMCHVAGIVDRANSMLDDRHGGIGPSYFMRTDLDEQWLELIWNHQIMPYLEEYFFGEPERLDDFRLERLQATMSQAQVGEHDDLDDASPSQ